MEEGGSKRSRAHDVINKKTHGKLAGFKMFKRIFSGTRV